MPATSWLAALLKPMWLSLIWTKLKLRWLGVGGAGAAAKSLDVGTPPAMVQSRPVPAQAMQERKLRRSMPSRGAVVVGVSGSVAGAFRLS